MQGRGLVSHANSLLESLKGLKYVGENQIPSSRMKNGLCWKQGDTFHLYEQASGSQKIELVRSFDALLSYP